MNFTIIYSQNDICQISYMKQLYSLK